MTWSIHAAVREAMRRAERESMDLNKFYTGWWSGERGQPSSAAVAVQPTTYHPEKTWDVVRSDQQGGLTVARGAEVRYVRSGEWLHDRKERVVVRRRDRWLEEGFVWTASVALPSPLVNRSQTRMYVAASPTCSSLERFANVVHCLNDVSLWFEAKCRHPFEGRRDQIVVWLDTRDVEEAISALSHLECERDDRSAPPPWTLHFGSLGVAQNPTNKMSFGMLVCAAIIASHDARSLGEASSAAWKRAARLHNLHRNRPWRHPGSFNDKRWEELECRAART